MGSLQADSEEKQEMDDSGCIQDETPPSKRYPNGVQGVQLLDLSDDVLLLILRYLSPRDLKAVGYTCPRLGTLILDRSLWQTVDARGQPWGRARLRWFLTRALHEGTRELLVAGYAREARECLGLVNQTREEYEAAKERRTKEEDNNNQPAEDRFTAQRVIEIPALGPNAQLFIDEQRPETPEFSWPRSADPLVSDSTCPGPQFTLTQHTLRQLSDTCPALTSLALEYCNINCNCTNIGMFPPTLKKLSLRGSKCYNLPLDRSFLFKIQDSLPDLESLDVSECDWMEPATLLPLSKLPALKHLYARDCLRLTEFVAYASLATRYGFTKLQSLDLRGSPVGDSEVSALGWLARLARLRLAPARGPPPRAQHQHRRQDRLPDHATEPGDEWEEQEPEYFKLKDLDYDSVSTSENSSSDTNHTWQARLNGNSSDYSTMPTVLSSATITSPTMIINAAPRRPAAASDPIIIHAGSGPRAASSSSAASSTSRASSSRADDSSSNSSTATGSTRTANSSPTPVRPGPSQSSTSPNISITRNTKCCNIITPSRLLKSNLKRKTSSPTPGPSKRKRDSSSSSSDDDVPLQCLVKNVNEGASTSKEPEDEDENDDEDQEDEEAQPRHHVLYVNVGQRLHAVYRLSLDNEHVVSFNRNTTHNRLDTRNMFLSPPGSHLDASSLVTDSAIRRFGRADGEDINYVHIGPNGPYPGAQVPGARPDRSSLTHLSVTGFRTITDRSLEHLATSAPLLEFLDLSETNVSDAGVAAFRSLRPDCEVVYSKYEKKD